MKQLFKKIPGFSLTEVLFNLILVGIIVSCGYLGYNYIFNDMSLFNKVNSDMNEYVQFSNAFIIDQSRSSIILKENEGLLLASDSAASVTYAFAKNFVTRTKNEVTDTFHIKTISLKCFYDKQETLSGLIESGSIELKCAGKKLVSSFSKKYDSYQLFKADSLRANYAGTFR